MGLLRRRRRRRRRRTAFTRFQTGVATPTSREGSMMLGLANTVLRSL
jgi:hypothetical protein